MGYRSDVAISIYKWELSNIVFIDRSFGRESYGVSIKAEDFLDGAHGESVDAGMKFDDMIGD